MRRSRSAFTWMTWSATSSSRRVGPTSNLPAIAMSEQCIQLGPDRYHLRAMGELLHPVREPQKTLDDCKQSMGSMDFAAQYQQEPVAEGGNLIKMGLVSDLR